MVEVRCDWWRRSVIGGSRDEAEASCLPQAFIAKWLPVISETTFHVKAPDVVVLLLLLLLFWVVSHCWGQILLPVVFLTK